MSKLSISAGRVYNSSAIVKISRCLGKGTMIIIIPEFVILESHDFSPIEQRDIVIALLKRQGKILEKAENSSYSLTVEI